MFWPSLYEYVLILQVTAADTLLFQSVVNILFYETKIHKNSALRALRNHAI